MQLSSSVTSRTLFLLVSLLCCARAAGPRPLNSPPRRISRRKENVESVAAPVELATTSAGDFSIAVNPAALTIPLSTQSFADGTITLTGLNGFADNVNVSCSVSGGSGLNQPGCLFPLLAFNNELFVDASDPSVTTEIEADAVQGICSPPDFCAVPPIVGGHSGLLAGAGVTLVLLSFSICVAGSLPKRLRAQILCVAIVCGGGLVAAGCSNGPSGASANGCPPGLGFTPGTPPGTYMMTVMAASGNLSHSVTIPVTVPAQ
jgi:hypothetical protein